MEARKDTAPKTGATGQARREIEALRREVERWHALAGGSRGLLEALLHHSPHGIIVSDAGGRLVVQNRASERIWAGSATAENVEGWGLYRAFHPDGTPYAPDDWSMARCLTRREIVEAEEVHFQRFDGSRGILLGSCAPIFGEDGALKGAISVFADITALKQAEEDRARWAARTERLLHITASLADAVSAAQVLEAVVDRSAAALQASSAGLWLVDDEGRSATLARAYGVGPEVAALHGRIDLDAPGTLPAADAIRTREAVWVGSRAELLERYPHLGAAAGPAHDAATASLPLSVEGRTIGVLALAFERGSAPAGDERALLVVVARHCAQALERMRLLREAELACAETERLYRLTDAVNRASSVAEVYDASLDTIGDALGVERAAILFFDPDGVMRFKASRGLSGAYREAVEGHAPWRPGDRDPRAVWIEDVERDASVSGFLPAFRAEQIRAIAFVPLVYEERLLGKFMLYWGEPRAFSEREHRVARSIADQVASAVGRQRAQQEREALIEQLSETVRLNELFTGVVGHDLRNPLSAIITAAELALRREEGERLFKPLSRILSSGERMRRMIEQLLDFTRARAGGGIPLDPREMDLGALGRQVTGEIEDANPERALVVEMEGELSGVWDADRLAQVISNLAGNAIQHGAPSAPVRVRFDGRDSAVVSMRFTNQGAVRADVLAAIFEPFRMSSDRRDRARGHGLGLRLYITHQIVLAHGGGIEVASSEEAGTTFTVTLPRRAA